MSEQRRFPETYWLHGRDHQMADGSDVKWGKIILHVLGGFFLLWLLLAGTVIVRTGEIAVMTRFGRVTGQELGEGLHVKIPIDRANKYDIKVLKTEAKAAAASKDLQDVQSTLVLNYSLEPGKVSDIHQQLGTDYSAKLIDPAIQEVFKASTARYNAQQLIQQRAEVKTTAVGLLRNRLSDYGIRVVDLSVTNFTFSAEFTQAIEAKQVAQQNAERAKFNLEASKTDAEAQKVQGATLTQQFLMKQFIEKWDGKLPQVMNSEGGLDFLLNLDKVTGQE